MCGISLVMCKNSAAVKAVDILCEMLHRGTSSTGIVYKSKSNELKMLKSTIAPIEFKIQYKNGLASINATIVLGHNRMPSKGEVSYNNAHPFISCNGLFGLVHNGTEDVSKFKDFLQLLGHNIAGETDSEVILHLFEEIYDRKKDMISAIQILQKTVSSTVLILTAAGEVYGFGNAVVIIVSKEGVFLASELSGLENMFNEKWRNVYVPHGKTIFKISEKGVEFFGEFEKRNKLIKKKEKELSIFNWKQFRVFNREDDNKSNKIAEDNRVVVYNDGEVFEW